MSAVAGQNGGRTEATVRSPDLHAQLQAVWPLLDVGPLADGVIGGQLLRPRLGLSAVEPLDRDFGTPSFWLGLLAVQLAHEASLLHDDVVDQAPVRREKPTLAETRGVGAALVAGDRLLARAYLAAVATGSLAFARRFARAVEDTVAGEEAQGRAAGQVLDDARVREISRLKSGALFGCALATRATLEGGDRAGELDRLGREVGLLYQRVDDLLDFCPEARTGKPPLADFASGIWTWPRAYLEPGATPDALFRKGERGIPALRAVSDLEGEGRLLLATVDDLVPHAEELRKAVTDWLATARQAVEREISRIHLIDSRERLTPSTRRPAPEAEPPAVLAKHGRSFHFASRLMPPDIRGPVARVYAFCRLVDDAVDRAPHPGAARARLQVLHQGARRAYEHEPEAGGFTGLARVGPGPGGSGEKTPDWLAAVMTEMREAAVPFSVVDRLVEGVASDLEAVSYEGWDDLRWYTHRVAGVVGLWMAGLAGCRDSWSLEMADELGHAMQLTNIARDVGADLAMGRVYLPGELLSRHGLDRKILERLARGGDPVPSGFAAVMEELMGRAEAGYGAAFQAIPNLPPGFRKAVVVAARVYGGIHDEIRRNGYDTLRLRARTGRFRKGWLALGALKDLRAAERRAGV
jgi:15-cis-phytoene synthase